jgi:hypothetical protein
VATTRIQPAMITLLIAFVVVTAGFYVMLSKESGAVDELMVKQKGEDKKRTELLNGLAEKKIMAARLHREVERLDTELAARRVYFDGEQLVSGVASASTVNSGKTLPASAVALNRAQVEVALKRLEKLAADFASDGWQQSPELSGLISKRQEQLADLDKRISDLEVAWRAQSDAQNAKGEQLAATLEKTRKAQDEEISTRLTRIGQMEVEIRKQLGLELHWLQDLDPVGRILQTAGSGRVVINLGAKDRVTPGLRFETFQYDRGNYIEKGMVEVVEVRPTISLCRVLSVVNGKTWPIASDDLLGNPAFSSVKPRVFVVAGDFLQFSKADIETFLRQSGAEVRDHLGPGVDVLVAGKNSERDQDRAREYQVEAMDEARLLKYLRPEFRPTVPGPVASK